eukprot:CAMPEP_0170564816 /NCGR_PEP_ID=MMETSP0211-20121228/75061_1 /TAXON_ID=311385 /ORGANISM="Pseudokeronopsis sp., Strain OXSARD2" /LENGTH=84 /DNA_ID=CAMNT_0010884761 /DNA_START=828 /DNA_END=1082 /DNA_ORIENTATION=-
MMKDDFKLFLDNYLNSLAALFEFYSNEGLQTFPIPLKFKNLCIQIDAITALLRDFNAFSNESGLNKGYMKTILGQITGHDAKLR